MKNSLTTAGVILVLSLAAWTYFYVASVPLTLAETTVVVGVVAALVVSIRWAWLKLRKPKEKPAATASKIANG